MIKELKNTGSFKLNLDSELDETFIGSIPAVKEAPEIAQEAPVRDKKKRTAWIVALLVILALVATGGILYKNYRDSFTVVPQAPQSFSDSACKVFEEASLGCVAKQVTHETQPIDALINQSINAGTEVKKDTPVTLTYSIGKDNYVVQEVLKRTVEDVQEDASPYNIKVVVVEEVDGSDLAKGRIVESTHVMGDTMKNGETIEVKISTGLIEVPDWTGKSRETVETEATNLGITVSIVEEESDETVGTVIKQDKTGKIQNSENITVTVAKKKAEDIVEVSIPDIIGKSEIEAQSLLAVEGFSNINIKRDAESESHDKVISVTPEVGEKAKNDTEITITLGE